ncbi:MAG: alpha/beta hydrolase [Desulfobacteraceae bacterium]|nr:alpha/beta hydrolase [Desulfobacteraceae bacterium]
MMENILAGSPVHPETSFFTTSDGVRLKIMDFFPPGWKEHDPVLVFVPGWVSLISGWKHVLNVVTQQLRVIYLETREKQSAEIPSGPYPEFTLQRMSQDLSEVIHDKIPEKTPFYLAGSSLGSSLILDYLKKDNQPKPENVILISPITHIDFPFWAKLIIRYVPPSAYTLIKHVVIFYLTRFRVDKTKEPEQAEKYRGTLSAAEPILLKANARALSGYSVWEGLNTIKSPIVLVGAKTDKLHGLSELEKMASLIPKARLEVMASNRESHSEKAGHLVLNEMIHTK